MIGHFWEWLSTTNPDAWAAVAAWATMMIAFVASIAAFRQVREARTLREEQAQPYVVVYIEQSQAAPHLIDLVVKNFGTTAARDVRIFPEPTLKRSAGRGKGVENVGLFSVLPVLVPQQEWRTFWDSGLSRKDVNLPDEHKVRIEYNDSRGRSMPATLAILDWSIYNNTLFTVIYGQHHTAKALREIKDVVKKWGEVGAKGLSVHVRDGDRRDERRAEQYREFEAHQSRLEKVPSELLSQSSTAETVDNQGEDDSTVQTTKDELMPDAVTQAEVEQTSGCVSN